MNYIKLHDVNKNIILVNFNQVLYVTTDIYSKRVNLFFSNRQTLHILESIEEIEAKIKEIK